MKLGNKRSLSLIMGLFLFWNCYSQNGPGGVGNATGSSGQPENVLWLKSNSGITSSGGLVDIWVDQSGNGNSASGTGGTRPTYTALDANFNNMPSITFPNTGGANFFLQVPDNDNLDNSSQLTVFFVIRPTSLTSAPNGILSKRSGAGINSSYVFEANTSYRYRANIANEGSNNIVSANSSANQLDIFSFVMNGTSQNGYFDGTNNTARTAAVSTIPNNSSNLYIGSYDNTVTTNFEGQIAEVVIYRSALNTAQRQLVENYLSSKYNSTITGDVFAGDTPGNGNYDFDLAGIGFNGGTSHFLANSQGFILSPSAGSLNTNGEFVIAAHNGVANTASVSNLGSGGVVQRWSRAWYIDRTPATGIDVNITFDFSEGIGGQFPQSKDNYVLLKLNGGNYDVVAAIANSDKSLVGDQITFRVADANLTDGVYTLGTLNSTVSPVTGVSNRTWYAYQSGNWTTANTWTLDGGLFPTLVNPLNETPGITDNVVIPSGKTVVMNSNNVVINSIDVTGELNVGATTGHNFVTINGTGRIKLSGATDNFPAGTATSFVDATTGGTVEINGTGIALNQARTFNNVDINLTGSSNVATIENNFTLNGNLIITNGLLKINNDVAIANRTINVYGDVNIASSGGIRTGIANARHEFNVYGDFTNEGTAYFTQRVAAATGAEATDGIVDVNMVSTTRNQQIICNGVTRFYRIEITKGTDDTFKATITASDPTYFNLYGAANYDINEANAAANGNGTNLNALGLNSGTVEIGTNVAIPVLNTISNYAIYEGAQLYINGGSVTKSAGTAIVPYGRLKISAGTLTASIGSGITIRDNGIIEVTGGTVNAQQIRTSVNGLSAVGSYIQSGGTVTLTGGAGISADYAVFSLTYSGNVFNMSGGTLIINNRPNLGTGNLRGAVFINSDPANISVTGGTVVMAANNAVNYRITSKAAFWNVTLQGTGGVRTIELLGTTSGTGGGASEPSISIQSLNVLNDFIIENNASFATNNADVVISGSLDIQNGGIYTPGTNTTTISGGGVSSLTFGNTVSTQVFNNLTINKTSSTNEVVIANGNATALRVNGTLTVTNGIFDYATFIVSSRGTVTLSSGVVIGKSTSTGKLLLDGTIDQTINSSGASLYNLEFNNTDASPVISLSGGDLSVLKTLTLTSGIFSIGVNKLTLSGASASISGSPFSVTKMIQTAGNSSDGGLEMYVNTNESIIFPVGVAGKYTPATATFQSYSDDGYVRIVPVNGVLQTTNLTGGTDILAFHWRSANSGFTVKPRVSYQFVYVNGDIGGTEANYRPGKVLDDSPFTRSADGATDDVIDASNTIVFNGTTSAGTFPGAGFTLEAASYTAGGTNRFTGTVNTYYSVSGGDWNTASNWSKNTVSGGTAEVPTAGSVAVIQTSGTSGHRMNVYATPISVAAVQFNHNYTNIPTPNSENVARLQFWNGNANTVGRVTGTGMISFNAPANPTVTGDFGDFGENPDSYFLYFGGNATLASIPTPIPNLMVESGTYTINQNITVNTDLISQGNAVLIPAQNIRIKRDLVLGYWTGGTFRFPGTAPALTITVERNIDFTQDPFSSPGNRNVNVNNPGVLTLEHSLVVKGNILQGASNSSVLDLYNGATNRPLVALEFQGTGTHSYSRTSTSVPDLYRIICNKGTDITSSFSLNSTVTLNAPTNTTVKPITITNGLLIMNNTGTYTLSSGGGDVNIPSTAGLQVSAGTVNFTTASTGLTLSGLLRINGGTATLDAGAGFDNYIEYSNTGTAAIQVTSGGLTVGTQIRRGLSSTTGVLKYTQSGGTVLVGNSGAPTSSRGVFEILNSGSQFNHSGGSLTIVRGINSTSVPSLWLEPASSSITSGSTITIGNASTPSGVNSQNIGVLSTATLNNLTIAGSNNPVVKIFITPLIVAGNLTVNSSTTFNANGQNLTVGGNFIIDGSYVASNNTTTFNNAGSAAISGTTALLNFYNFRKLRNGALTVSKDVTINNDLEISAGIVNTSTFAVNLKRHALVDGTMASTSGAGLVFNGSVQQQLSRSASGTSTLGIMTVNNSLGVIIPDGNGYNFNLSTGLKLQQGVFDIGGSLLFLQMNATITPVNPFSLTNMIQTNSSFTDKGVKKQFPLSYTSDFTFPVGQFSYTPVTFNFSSPTNTTGFTGTPTITVRPSNERHPSVVDDNQVGELPSPAAFNDLDNVLQYHWIVNADNVASTFKSAMTLSYPQSLVSATAPYTEADYLAARILSDANPSRLLNKFSITDVDETLNTITFNFSGVTDSGISAEYFAGVDIAIPDNVPIYTTTGSGNANAAIYTPAVPGGGIPTGASVIVQTGHVLTLNTSGANFYQTQINDGATLIIPSGSIGHRLGTLTGTGSLNLVTNGSGSSPVMPAAVFDDFFSCTGGTLIYSGNSTTSYTVLSGVTALKNLTIDATGGGTLIFPNNDIVVCNDFTLTNGLVGNSNNRIINIQNDYLQNSGTFSNGSGDLILTRDFVLTNGAFNGGTGGTKTIGRSLTINGGTFTAGSGTTNVINIGGDFTLAGGATFTGGTSSSTGMKFVFQGSSMQTLTGDFSGTRKLNRLELNNLNGVLMAGNVEIDRELLFTSGTITPATNQLLMGSNAVATPTEGNATSFVNGKLYKVVPTTAGFVFPIGKGGLWRSGSVSNLSAAGDTWDMEYFYAPATNEALVNNLTPVAPVLKIAGGEYWKVSDGAAVGRTAKIGLSWGGLSDVSNVTAEREALTVVVWNDAMTRWDNYSGTNFSAGHTQSRGTFNSTSNVSFSENIVTLGSTEEANPLPVELIDFVGVQEDGFTKLTWWTASELNNDYFEIERSGDGETFVMAGRQQGKGTTNKKSTYTMFDEQPLTGNNYYRLKIVALDGTYEYSKIIRVNYEMQPDQFTLSVYPNPVKEGKSIFIRSVKASESNAIIIIRDITGREMQRIMIGSRKEESVDVSMEKIDAGVYFIEMIQGARRVVKRLVIE